MATYSGSNGVYVAITGFLYVDVTDSTLADPGREKGARAPPPENRFDPFIYIVFGCL